MPDISAIIEKAKARESRVTLYLDGATAGEIEALEGQLAALGADTWTPDSLGAAHPGMPLAKKIEAARKRLKASATEFVFRALGDTAWSNLVAAHPPTRDDHMWDPETFPRALVAACAIDPTMTPEQRDGLYEILNDGQRKQLENAAYECNAGATALPFSVTASGILAGITDGS